MTEKRKLDHIELAKNSQSSEEGRDDRFLYEPLLAGNELQPLPEISILGKKLSAPLWISSMTGGADLAKTINTRLARACRKYKIGIGLGSCRSLLQNDERLGDFDIRSLCGDEVVLMANIGIAQIEHLAAKNQLGRLKELMKKLQADALIAHINPLQELFQPEGDRYASSPIELLKELCDTGIPIAVKEVGQGMGPESLRELTRLPIVLLETASYGGTNFSLLETKRKNESGALEETLTQVGHNNAQMLGWLKQLSNIDIPIVFSGGVKSALDGYYWTQSYPGQALYGIASRILQPALKSDEALDEMLAKEIRTLQVAHQFLTLNPNY